MPLQATSGAASYDAFGGGAPYVPVYIEDLFSTWLYTGNGSTQTITNGIDLSTKGGMVWVKSRSAATSNFLFDTTRGVLNEINSDRNDAQASLANSVTAFNADGFSLGSAAGINVNAATYASWTFREQEKFFDVVTYTGTGANRTIAHSLGSVPGCIMVKSTDTTGNWQVYHSSLANTEYLVLNSSAGKATGATRWNSTTPTSTVFSLGTDATVNANGGTYVAYIYASNAGGFGLAGTDNVITCGSFTAPALNSSVSVNLGYEPQWILFKDVNNTADAWYVADSMRGFNLKNATYLTANNSNPEGTFTFPYWIPTATGFTNQNAAAAVFTPGNTVIYIAIRRGPMRVPTTGTSVFSPITSSNTVGTAQTTSFPVDMQIAGSRTIPDADGNWAFNDRLRGVSTTSTQFQNSLLSATTAAETTGGSNFTRFWNNTGFQTPSYWANLSSIYLNFRRAPGFFDEVCWTTIASSSQSITHNLGVVPELMIVKSRTSVVSWYVYSTTTGNSGWMGVNSASPVGTRTNLWGASGPTSTTFTFDSSWAIGSGQNVVTYLFATCAGVSKVGTYTGTGTQQTINCGFTGGARFVLVKATSSSGNWLVWDSARGIVAGNDPYLALNSTAAEVTSTDWVDTAATGFELSNNAGNLANTNGVSYIYLAIA